MQTEPYIQRMHAPETIPVLCIVGPTGAGKTHLAMLLAEHAKSIGLTIELISMDSALVYRGLNIGSAKPTKAEQASVTHHLIDILEPTEVYSAARFAKDAKRLCEEIRSRGNIPIVVGGTMLYWRAWAHGLPLCRLLIQKFVRDWMRKAKQSAGQPCMKNFLASIQKLQHA